jgi:hypothetical protein
VKSFNMNLMCFLSGCLIVVNITCTALIPYMCVILLNRLLGNLMSPKLL